VVLGGWAFSYERGTPLCFYLSLALSLSLGVVNGLAGSNAVPRRTQSRRGHSAPHTRCSPYTPPRPLSSKYGTYRTVKARFWPWLSGTLLRCSLSARTRYLVVHKAEGVILRRTPVVLLTHPYLQGVGCRVEGVGCRVEGIGFRVQGAGCRV